MKRFIYLFLLLTTMIFADSTQNLFDAVKKLDASNVKVSIENNANINAKDSLGNTPLDYLISDYDLETGSVKDTDMKNSNMQKKYEIAKLLISEDANINITRVFKDKILFYLIIKMTLANIQLAEDTEKEKLEITNDINFFNLIVDTGIDLNNMSIKVNKNSLNLMDFTVTRIATINTTLKKQTESRGLDKIIQILIDKKLSVSEGFNQVLLNYAVKLNNQKIVLAMLESGADVNVMLGDEFPTYLAAKNNSVEMLKLLESKGGYINGLNNKNESPLSAAVENSSLDAVKYLMENGANPTQLSSDRIYLIMKAIKHSNNPENKAAKEIVKILLNTDDVDVNCEVGLFSGYFDNSYAFSPLSISTDLEILKLLIEKGADVDMKSEIGSTALMNTLDVNKIDFLLKNGANINAVNDTNDSALTNIFRIVEEGAFKLDSKPLNEEYMKLVARLLIEKGINVNIVNNKGYDAFLYAINFGFKDIINLLIEKGTDIKRKNQKGENALLLSAEGGNYETSKLLIEKGLKVNTVDNEGITPLMKAVSSLNIDLIKLLIEKGADVNAKTLSGQTVLEISKIDSNEEITNLLIKSGAK